MARGSGWCRSGRTCSPARSRSNLRYGNPERHRRRAVGRAGDRPGRGLRAGDARGARRADRAGRHQRLRRSAAAARDRPRAGASRRRSTCSTTRSPRSTSPPTPGCGRRCARSPRTPRWSSSPSGSRRSSTPTRSSCSRTARSSASARTTSCSATCPTYAEIVESQLARGGGRMSTHDRTAPAARTPTREDAGETAARRPRDGRAAPPGRRRPPWAAASGMPAEKSMTSGRRRSGCCGGCAPERLGLHRRARARRGQRGADRRRAEDPRPRHRHHLRRCARPAAARRA